MSDYMSRIIDLVCEGYTLDQAEAILRTHNDE